MTRRIWEIFTRVLKSLKIGTLIDFLIQRRKLMSLKFKGELFVMAMKNDARLKEELTCNFKTDMTNLTNFDPSTQKYQSFAL